MDPQVEMSRVSKLKRVLVAFCTEFLAEVLVTVGVLAVVVVLLFIWISDLHKAFKIIFTMILFVGPVIPLYWLLRRRSQRKDNGPEAR